MNNIWIVPIAVALVAALGTYLGVARRTSGRIATTEASDLWKEATSIRELYRSENSRLRERLDDIEERLTLVERDNASLRRKNDELERENRKLHAENETLKAEVLRLERRVDELEKVNGP